MLSSLNVWVSTVVLQPTMLSQLVSMHHEFTALPDGEATDKMFGMLESL